MLVDFKDDLYCKKKKINKLLFFNSFRILLRKKFVQYINKK